jgi:parallel beta-helix repeat protein
MRDFKPRGATRSAWLFLLILAVNIGCATSQLTGLEDVVRVTAYFPEGFVTDGSESYTEQIQQALDETAERGGALVFPPMVYQLDRVEGLLVHGDTTLLMHGAEFRLPRRAQADGQAFLGVDVKNLRMAGGTVRGYRDVWPGGANIAGVRIMGESSGIRIEDMTFRDLSSNGIGLFAEDADTPIRDVRVRNVDVYNCCNYYGDYLSERKGPAPGSDRKDQGGVAFYHVEDFLVTGSTFDGSQSDGTHFYKCRDGRFTDNMVSNSRMGGYFLEGCENVMAANNTVHGNGSRGVTIERNSRYCTLVNNLVEGSGREGLWAPDIEACVIANNVFRENGRKDDGERDCEIRIDNGDRYETQTRDLRIEGNIFTTTAHQTAAILVTENVGPVIIRGNTLRGSVTHIAVHPTSRTGAILEDHKGNALSPSGD